jgi:hypothetical protein
VPFSVTVADVGACVFSLRAILSVFKFFLLSSNSLFVIASTYIGIRSDRHHDSAHKTDPVLTVMIRVARACQLEELPRREPSSYNREIRGFTGSFDGITRRIIREPHLVGIREASTWKLVFVGNSSS